MPLFGYARVSTRDQNLVAQDAELRAAGCAKVFKEKISGAKTDRADLVKVIGRLEPSDVEPARQCAMHEFDRQQPRPHGFGRSCCSCRQLDGSNGSDALAWRSVRSSRGCWSRATGRRRTPATIT